MDKSLLKSGLFGYTKSSVCEYVAGLNEEFSRKLIDSLAEQESIQKKLKERIVQLEEEIERYRNLKGDVAEVLLDARNYASKLREDAEAENKRLKEENAKRNMEETHRIQEYKKGIDEIRKELHQLLNRMDDDLRHNTDHISKIQENFSNGDTGMVEKNENEQAV